jgi:hypothetical protein
LPLPFVPRFAVFPTRKLAPSFQYGVRAAVRIFVVIYSNAADVLNWFGEPALGNEWFTMNGLFTMRVKLLS